MLVDRCLRFVGRELYVRPFYGWGWSVGHDEFERIEGAGVFSIRVERFFRFNGELRGLVGVVTREGHVFSGQHVVAAEMLQGAHDFEDDLCHRYDLELGSTPAAGREDWPTISSPDVVRGYGTIGVSRARIDTYLEALAGGR